MENPNLENKVQLSYKFLRQKILDFSTILEPYGLQSSMNLVIFVLKTSTIY